MNSNFQYRLFPDENSAETEIKKTINQLTPTTMKEGNEKEIDLSDIFSNTRKFFSNIYHGIIRGMVNSLYFLKINRKIIGTMMVLGIIAGLVYSLAGKPFHTSTMVVKSNDRYFEKNIIIKILDELNTMCEEEDFEELSSLLNITAEQAKSLREFELEEEKEVANLGAYYNKYFRILSTVPDEEEREELLSTFIQSEKDNIYYISASSYDASILPLLNEPLVKLLNANPYFVKIRGVNDVALKASEQKIYNELTKLDSLKYTLTRAIELSDREVKSGSNNIFLGENQLYNPLPVYEKYINMYNDAIGIKKQISYNENTVDILSGFVKLKKNARLHPILSSLLGAAVGLAGGVLLVLFLLAAEGFKKLELPTKDHNY